MPNNYTQASSERLQESVQLAQNSGHSNIEPLHLLASILHALESINQSLLERAGCNIASLKINVDNALSRLAKISGESAQVLASQELANVLKSAEKAMTKMGDSYTTEEHLMIGLLDSAKSLEGIFKSS